MARTTRIRAVYRKDLAEILRDRRTLIAMIVIPVVLYPLMMLGFVWMAEQEDPGAVLDDPAVHAANRRAGNRKE